MATTTKTATKAYHGAVENITRLERSLELARRLRADAVRGMRDAGMTWAQIEEETGLTRQRLNKLTNDWPAAT